MASVSTYKKKLRNSVFTAADAITPIMLGGGGAWFIFELVVCVKCQLRGSFSGVWLFSSVS